MAKKETDKVVSPTKVPATGTYTLPLASASKVTAAARKQRPQTAPQKVVPSLETYRAAIADLLAGGKVG